MYGEGSVRPAKEAAKKCPKAERDKAMAYKIVKPEQGCPVQGVLFDMDGVVLDTEKLYTRFWIEAAGEAGYSMSWQQALGMRSLNSVWGQQYLEKCFGKGIDYMALREIRIRRMNAWIDLHGVDAKPGAAQLLNFLHQNKIPCAITTSSPPQRVKDHLTPLGLYEKFDKICSGYEVKNGKPAPDIYLYGAQSLGLAPQSCIALEDSPTGIESAFRAGCMPVVVPDLDEPGEETLNRSFARVDTLADVCGLIEQLKG